MQALLGFFIPWILGSSIAYFIYHAIWGKRRRERDGD